MDRENPNYKLAIQLLDWLNFDTTLAVVQEDAEALAEMIEDNLESRES